MVENLHHWLYNDKSHMFDPILGIICFKIRKNANNFNEKNIFLFNWKIKKFGGKYCICQ